MRLHSLVTFAFSLSLVWMLPTTSLSAQTTPVPANGVTADQVNDVARDLWCPLCSGVRLDVCDLQACEQMRQEIGLKLTAGEDAASIKQDFLDQYGPQVLGEPPRAGFSWLGWILPFAVLLGGAIFLLLRNRHLLFPQSVGDRSFETATESAKESAASPRAADQDDPFAQRLEEELKRYD
ncbi:MAG: cytochrome c-type biogenesis protein CcmH [Chloroflexota bacterium]|nr:cytochrome c-type biogenesis protein CcmH [Chloroflexota bacterium]